LRRRRPDLAAGDPVDVAIAHRHGLQTPGVQPGIRFGHTETGTLGAGDQRRQEALLLLLGAEHHNRVQTEDVDVDRRGRRHRTGRVRQPLHHQCRLGQAEPGAADILRHGDAEPPALGDRPGIFVRKTCGLVRLAPVVIAESICNLSNGFNQRVLVFSE
jgi:hypothetical protein